MISLRSARQAPELTVPQSLRGPTAQTDQGALTIESLFDLASLGESSVSVPSRRTVVREGDRANTVYLVQSGMLRSTTELPDGRRQILSFQEAGDLIGLLENDVHICSVESVTSVQLKAANRARLLTLLDGRPQWRNYILSFAARELASAQHRALMLGRQTAQERLISFLIHLRRDDMIDLRMPRKDIADYIGLTVETVSRILTQLERHGLIQRIGARTIQIKDLSRLVPSQAD